MSEPGHSFLGDKSCQTGRRNRAAGANCLPSIVCYLDFFPEVTFIRSPALMQREAEGLRPLGSQDNNRTMPQESLSAVAKVSL